MTWQGLEEAEGAEASEATAVSLPGILRRLAASQPGALLLGDEPDRIGWSGRPSRLRTRAEAAEVVDRAAALLAGFRLPTAATVAICLPSGVEAWLAALAVMDAGLTPAFLPLAAGEDALAAMLDASAARAVVTQGRVGDLRPAEAFCRLAASRFRLRFLLAFGPDVPDGVVDLDAALAVGQGRTARPGPSGGIMTFEPSGTAVSRSPAALAAAAALVLQAAGYRPGERVLSLVACDDLAGLAAGPAAALLGGAAFEGHAFLDPDRLTRALGSCGPTHLVAPAGLEVSLRRRGLDRMAVSLVFVHRGLSAYRSALPLPPASQVVDVVAIGERAAIPVRRTADGAPGLSSDGSFSAPHGLLDMRPVGGGALELRGLAAQAVLGHLPARTVEPAPGAHAWQRVDEVANADPQSLTVVQPSSYTLVVAVR